MSKLEKDNLYYDKVYQWGGLNGNYHKSPEETHYFPIWNKIIQTMNEESIIADFGCGVGQFAELVLKNGLNYAYGVDFSEKAIKMANERNGQDYFYVANLYDESSFRIKNYNTAILLEVLEHVEQDLKIISYIPEAVRVIFSVPNFDDLSHLRTYDLESISRRYESLLDIKEISTFVIKGRAVIYLCDAIRKSEIVKNVGL